MKAVSLTFVLSAFVALSAIGCDQADRSLSANDMLADASFGQDADLASMQDELAKLALEPLSPEEAAGLAYMREEEKLARDVYTAMYTKWNLRPFTNIARSEQQHMDAVLSLVTRYELTDPVGSDGPGVFKNADLAKLYTDLMAKASTSASDALTVGATIEEVDIVDLQKHLKETDNADITLVYDNLMRGSRNHLRAFVKNLSAQGITYAPQYLTEAEYKAIITTDVERGSANGRGKGAGKGRR